MGSNKRARLSVVAALVLYFCYWCRRNCIRNFSELVDAIACALSKTRRRVGSREIAPLTTDPWAGASSRAAAAKSGSGSAASKLGSPQDVTSKCQWCSVPRDEAEGTEWKGKWYCNKCNDRWEEKKISKKLRLARYSREPTVPQDGEFHWIPNFLSPEEAERTFDALVSELKLTENGVIDWSCHQKCEEPQQSKTFNDLIHRLTEHFCVKPCEARLNYFRNGDDWKPFHHDSHIFHNEAKLQENFTVGISFGALREFAIREPLSRAEIALECRSGDLFAFDTRFNQVVQHGVLPGPPNSKGRISIVAWCNRYAHERYSTALAEFKAARALLEAASLTTDTPRGPPLSLETQSSTPFSMETLQKGPREFDVESTEEATTGTPSPALGANYPEDGSAWNAFGAQKENRGSTLTTTQVEETQVAEQFPERTLATDAVTDPHATKQLVIPSQVTGEVTDPHAAKQLVIPSQVTGEVTDPYAAKQLVIPSQVTGEVTDTNAAKQLEEASQVTRGAPDVFVAERSEVAGQVTDNAEVVGTPATELLRRLSQQTSEVTDILTVEQLEDLSQQTRGTADAFAAQHLKKRCQHIDEVADNPVVEELKDLFLQTGEVADSPAAEQHKDLSLHTGDSAATPVREQLVDLSQQTGKVADATSAQELKDLRQEISEGADAPVAEQLKDLRLQIGESAATPVREEREDLSQQTGEVADTSSAKENKSLSQQTTEAADSPAAKQLKDLRLQIGESVGTPVREQREDLSQQSGKAADAPSAQELKDLRQQTNEGADAPVQELLKDPTQATDEAADAPTTPNGHHDESEKAMPKAHSKKRHRNKARRR